MPTTSPRPRTTCMSHYPQARFAQQGLYASLRDAHDLFEAGDMHTTIYHVPVLIRNFIVHEGRASRDSLGEVVGTSAEKQVTSDERSKPGENVLPKPLRRHRRGRGISTQMQVTAERSEPGIASTKYPATASERSGASR